MKILEYYQPGEEGYARAALFAEGVYKEKLNFHLDHFPEFLFSIEEDEKVLGCIGLNHDVHGSLFLRDQHVKKFITETQKRETVGEQSILAVDACPFGVVLLIAAFTECAHYLGIDMIMFACTEIAIRTLLHMDTKITIIKEADERTLLPSEKENYRTWFLLNKPMVCTITTAQMPEIASTIFMQHQKWLVIGKKLQSIRNEGIIA